MQKEKAAIKPRLFSVTDVMEGYRVGRNVAYRIGKESGALRKIGKKNYYDPEVIDQYINNLGA